MGGCYRVGYTGISLLLKFFHAEYRPGGNGVVKVAGNFTSLFSYVCTQGRSNFDMMARYLYLHVCSPFICRYARLGLDRHINTALYSYYTYSDNNPRVLNRALTRDSHHVGELETAPIREIRTIESVALRPELLWLAVGLLLLELVGAATRGLRVLHA